MPSERLSREERLCRRQDYLRVYRQGVRLYLPYLTIIVAPNRVGITRLGISVSREIKGAVKRNRTKRLLREFFRRHKSLFPKGHDVVFIARGDLWKRKFEDLERGLKEEFSKKWPEFLSG
ncbi:ribonuclease P protein component [Thermosulfuriphilus sp.]